MRLVLRYSRNSTSFPSSAKLAVPLETKVRYWPLADGPTKLRMSAFGVKRTWLFALQMSAYGPKRTCGEPLNDLFLNSTPGRTYARLSLYDARGSWASEEALRRREFITHCF